MTVKTSVSLTDEQDAYARALVVTGRYASVSAVLQRGLEMLRRENEIHDAEIQALQTLIDRRRAGVIVPMEASAEDFLAAVERES
ncbi:MAG TPA: type II toxin-antitoxin system ParD family antitoxin [Rhodopila sp.]|nr:type II toxin-antitoxin system ParD family antitoxin [Rhodopila sp.]